VRPDAEAYLRKARESLAWAEADVKAGRYNSAANRAYYAAFQASVALLIENNIRPRRDAWEHRFVISQVSGKLITRRKVLPGRLTGLLDTLLERRLRADYRTTSASRREANDSMNKATDLVNEVRRATEE
jgi:uncharacterized protein (UPF0332 family)